MDPIEQNQKSNKGVIAGAVALLLIAGGAFATFKFSSNNGAATPDSNDNIPLTNTPVALNSKYRDGSYSADGNYESPGGNEFIKVTLVLKDDVITGASVFIADDTRKESKYFQEIFASDFKQYVIGKSLDQVSLSKVSGSSLTPIGFNDAVAKIKAEAKA